MNDLVDDHSLIFFARPATVFVVRQKPVLFGDVHDGAEQLSGQRLGLYRSERGNIRDRYHWAQPVSPEKHAQHRNKQRVRIGPRHADTPGPDASGQNGLSSPALHEHTPDSDRTSKSATNSVDYPALLFLVAVIAVWGTVALLLSVLVVRETIDWWYRRRSRGAHHPASPAARTVVEIERRLRHEAAVAPGHRPASPDDRCLQRADHSARGGAAASITARGRSPHSAGLAGRWTPARSERRATAVVVERRGRGDRPCAARSRRGPRRGGRGS